MARLIDRVIVKGKGAPLELFELRHKFSPENFCEIAQDYEEAFMLYQSGNFPDAEQRFRALSSFDRPSAVFAERCANLAAEPPQEWRGVFVMATK
jgi:adenylate cyclase